MTYWLYLNVLERKSACFEDEESELFIEVDCFNVEPVLCPAPEGLSQQQVMLKFPSTRFLFISCWHSCIRKPFKTSEDPVSDLFFGILSSQLVRRCILGSILESEKNYLDALKRILEVWRHICSNFQNIVLKWCLVRVLLSALSAIWEAPVPDWAQAAQWQETEDNLLSCARDPAVPLPVPDCTGKPCGWVG